MLSSLSKTVAVILTVLGNVLLLETGVLAQDYSVSEQPTASKSPAVESDAMKQFT